MRSRAVCSASSRACICVSRSSISLVCAVIDSTALSIRPPVFVQVLIVAWNGAMAPDASLRRLATAVGFCARASASLASSSCSRLVVPFAAPGAPVVTPICPSDV